jgi:hypothetical protein
MDFGQNCRERRQLATSLSTRAVVITTSATLETYMAQEIEPERRTARIATLLVLFSKDRSCRRNGEQTHNVARSPARALVLVWRDRLLSGGGMGP